MDTRGNVQEYWAISMELGWGRRRMHKELGPKDPAFGSGAIGGLLACVWCAGVMENWSAGV